MIITNDYYSIVNFIDNSEKQEAPSEIISGIFYKDIFRAQKLMEPPIGDNLIVDLIGAGYAEVTNKINFSRKRNIKISSYNEYKSLRDELRGNFILILRSHGFIQLETDLIGPFPIFYAFKSNFFYISSNLEIFNKFGFNPINSSLKKIFVALHSPGGHFGSTALAEVSRLKPGEKIRIELEEGSHFPNVTICPRESDATSSPGLPFHEDGSVPSNDSVINAAISAVRGVRYAKDIILHITGGSDSRALLAIMKSLNANPTLLYGRGRDRVTNTRIEDEFIVNLLARTYGLGLLWYDWSFLSGPKTENSAVKNDLNFTSYLDVYGGKKSFKDAVAGYPCEEGAYHVLGYSPVVTNVNIETLLSSTCYNDVADFIMADYAHIFADKKQRLEYRELITNELEIISEHYCINLEHSNAFAYLYFLFRVPGESDMARYLQNHCDVYCPFFDPHFFWSAARRRVMVKDGNVASWLCRSLFPKDRVPQFSGRRFSINILNNWRVKVWSPFDWFALVDLTLRRFKYPGKKKKSRSGGALGVAQDMNHLSWESAGVIVNSLSDINLDIEVLQRVYLPKLLRLKYICARF